MEFKVGDRVKFINSYEPPYNLVGTVVCIDNRETPPYGVRFDAPFEDGHKLDGYCEDGYGWWCDGYELELLAERQLNAEDLYKIWEGDI